MCEADITSSIAKNAYHKIDKHLRQQIITRCGDANVTVGTKHIDSALCVYISAHLICMEKLANHRHL